MSVVPLDDFKAHVNKVAATGADAAELQLFLDAAEEKVVGIIGPIEPTVVTEVHHTRGLTTTAIVLRKRHVIDLVDISSFYGVASTPLTLTDYQLDTSTGMVWPVSGSTLYGSFTVTYHAGFDTLPASVRLAVLIIAANLWRTQRGGGSVRPAFPGEGAEDATPTTAHLIPYRAQELLESYLPMAGIA